MGNQQSKYMIFQEASLSQKLAHKIREYEDYAGSDQELSLKIARLKVLTEFGLIPIPSILLKFVFRLLDQERKAKFATSKDVNEITKMGLQMHKRELEFSGSAEGEEED